MDIVFQQSHLQLVGVPCHATKQTVNVLIYKKKSFFFQFFISTNQLIALVLHNDSLSWFQQFQIKNSLCVSPNTGNGLLLVDSVQVERLKAILTLTMIFFILDLYNKYISHRRVGILSRNDFLYRARREREIFKH